MGTLALFLHAYISHCESATVTFKTYYGLGELERRKKKTLLITSHLSAEDVLKASCPAYGLPCSEMNLATITAVQKIGIANECGQCFQVNNLSTKKSVHVMAVDEGE